jgi:hypothetical protein
MADFVDLKELNSSAAPWPFLEWIEMTFFPLSSIRFPVIPCITVT